MGEQIFKKNSTFTRPKPAGYLSLSIFEISE